ncbi:MAG: hypothetical protein JRF33_15935 [Deltaproteobacteria bacterium]|nr:hypothetical protein [Deltaproteobacteria bacterium]
MKKNPTQEEWLGIAIGITEQGQISPTHFGDADRVILARIQSGAFELLDEIPNPLKDEEEDEDHGNRKKLKKAEAFLENIQIVATSKASINLKRLQTNSGKWSVVSNKSPEALLSYLSEHIDNLQSWFSNPDKGIFRT